MKRMLLIVFLVMGFTALFEGPALADAIMIAPSAFIVAQPGYPGTIHNTHSSSLSLYTDSVYRYYYAPVTLPQGAQVTSVVVFYEDDDVYNIRVTMKRRNMYNAVEQQMCQWESSSDIAGWQNHKISPISYWNINNMGYTYYIEVYFTGAPSIVFDLAVMGIRINYN